MIIKVSVFAGLKEFFEPEFEVEVPFGTSVSDLVDQLKHSHTAGAHLLDKCRFAVAEEFVPLTYTLVSHEHLYFLPPSSGG